jgi:hypothetical protein
VSAAAFTEREMGVGAPGMEFLTILNVCFAAWVFRGTAMTAAMPEKHMAKSAMPHTGPGLAVPLSPAVT